MKPFISVCGCGNVLLGDDGFGPAVVRDMQNRFAIPPQVQLADVGTAVREYLLDCLLSKKRRPDILIIIDAVSFPQRKVGEVFTVSPSSVPHEKIHDFSLHQFPTVNMLLELEQYTQTKVIVVAVQVDSETVLNPVLSDRISGAVPEASRLVAEIIGEYIEELVNPYDV